MGGLNEKNDLNNGKLPSGESITEVVNKYKHSSWVGIIASCVSMEIAENSILEFKKQNLPFGFKVNLWAVSYTHLTLPTIYSV